MASRKTDTYQIEPRTYVLFRLWWPRRKFAKIFGIRKLESLDYRMALFAWSRI